MVLKQTYIVKKHRSLQILQVKLQVGADKLSNGPLHPDMSHTSATGLCGECSDDQYYKYSMCVLDIYAQSRSLKECWCRLVSRQVM